MTVIDKFTIIEFAILITNCLFRCLLQHWQNTFTEFLWFSEKLYFRSPLTGYLFYYCFDLLICIIDTPGEAFCHSLKEAIEDRRKWGKKPRKIQYDGYMQWALCMTYSFYHHRIHCKTCLSHIRSPLTILSEHKRNLSHFRQNLRDIALSFLLFHAVQFLLRLKVQFLWDLPLSLRPILHIR